MKKTVNLTIRIDEKLKAEAEKACLYHGETLSAVLRLALRSYVRRFHEDRARATRAAREFSEGEHAQLAYDALAREVAKTSSGPPRQITEGDGVSALVSTMSRSMRRKYERDKAKGKV